MVVIYEVLFDNMLEFRWGSLMNVCCLATNFFLLTELLYLADNRFVLF